MLQMQKKLSNSFYSILSLPSTAMGFALSIQIAALSWLMRTKYNLDLHEIGFVWAAGPLAGIIGQPIVGLISDKVWFWKGRRRPFILIGGTIAALMLFALPNIDKISGFFGVGNIIVVAVFVALTLDLAINVSFNPTRAIIADVTPEGVQRTKGFTWMQTISGSFGVLAYALGAIFGNYFLIFFGVFLVLAFSLIPMFFIEEPRDLQTALAENEPESKTDWNQFSKLLLAHSFSWIGVQTMFVYMIGYVEQKLNPSTSDETGQILSISFLILSAVGAILPVFVLEPITEKIGRVKTHLSCVAVMSLAYFGIVVLGNSSMIVWILMAVAGVGWAAIVSLPFAIMSEKVNKNRMGLFMGIFNLSVVLPQLFVSLVLGTFVQNAGDKNIIFIISAISLAVSALLWLMVHDSKVKTVSDNKLASGH
ncbi:MAG: MFS transporter [Melioribacteraceae bacterium]